jgi:hypothetical protein
LVFLVGRLAGLRRAGAARDRFVHSKKIHVRIATYVVDADAATLRRHAGGRRLPSVDVSDGSDRAVIPDVPPVP